MTALNLLITTQILVSVGYPMTESQVIKTILKWLIDAINSSSPEYSIPYQEWKVIQEYLLENGYKEGIAGYIKDHTGAFRLFNFFVEEGISSVIDFQDSKNHKFLVPTHLKMLTSDPKITIRDAP